ncbi:MAG: VWA domain-containing protein [Pseudomonadota bacterium]
MLEFLYPWCVVLLPLPLLVRWLAPGRRETVSAIRVPFFGALAGGAGQEPRAGSAIREAGFVQTGLAVVVWLWLVAALPAPQWAGEPIERTEAARDIMLAIDLSGSMDLRDFGGEGEEPVQRLDAVKDVVATFIAARGDDRVGLIVFGTRAYVQVPFTRDLRTVEALLRASTVGMAGPHTALGDAVGLAIRTFETSDVDERVLIVLTDGSDTGSRMSPINAAEIARQRDVVMFAVGAGDPDASGENRVDHETLRRMADTTQGLFFEAGDRAGLDAVYARIDAALPRTVRTISYRPKTALAFVPAGLALVLCLAWGAVNWLRNRPVQPEVPAA